MVPCPGSLSTSNVPLFHISYIAILRGCESISHAQMVEFAVGAGSYGDL